MGGAIHEAKRLVGSRLRTTILIIWFTRLAANATAPFEQRRLARRLAQAALLSARHSLAVKSAPHEQNSFCVELIEPCFGSVISLMYDFQKHFRICQINGVIKIFKVRINSNLVAI